jgi:hypothetical protein
MSSSSNDSSPIRMTFLSIPQVSNPIDVYNRLAGTFLVWTDNFICVISAIPAAISRDSSYDDKSGSPWSVEAYACRNRLYSTLLA